MLDFRLETFLSVCDTMNYRRSAELLHITQPAVTQHIQHLEKFYGHKLFRYEGRRLKKTAAAELLEQYARTMKINEADMLRQMDERQIHDLRIGVTKTIAQCVIGQYAEHFLRPRQRPDPDRRKYPESSGSDRPMQAGFCPDRGGLRPQEVRLYPLQHRAFCGDLCPRPSLCPSGGDHRAAS